jgi:hypothetical protein
MMKTKNKMKDFYAESKEWWGVTKEYFVKELEKNLSHHRANERNLKYKVECEVTFRPSTPGSTR